jgi:hypothetical protein
MTCPTGNEPSMPDHVMPFNTVFVGGAPRSGTSVTHALLCTAPGSNAYHPEISFIRPVFESYVVGMAQWQAHTAVFFQSPEELRRHVARLAQESMTLVWNILERPKVLCVKDPLLTRNFAAVRAVMEWPCQFVTVLRHPHDVVRSQQEVYSRSGVTMDTVEVYRLCQEYMLSYMHIDDPDMDGSVFHFRYEDLGQDWLTDQLRAFTGMGGIDPALLWNKGAHEPSEQEKADPFYSPKYHSPIDTARRLDPLAPEFQRIVNDLCGPIMERCGYQPDGGVDRW